MNREKIKEIKDNEKIRGCGEEKQENAPCPCLCLCLCASIQSSIHPYPYLYLYPYHWYALLSETKLENISELSWTASLLWKAEGIYTSRWTRTERQRQRLSVIQSQSLPIWKGGGIHTTCHPNVSIKNRDQLIEFLWLDKTKVKRATPPMDRYVTVHSALISNWKGKERQSGEWDEALNWRRCIASNR